MTIVMIGIRAFGNMCFQMTFFSTWPFALAVTTKSARKTSSMEDLVWRALPAMPPTPAARTGMMKHFQLLVPIAGSQPSFTENRTIIIRASQKSGTETRIIEIAMERLSCHLLWWTAAKTPSGMPTTTWITIARPPTRIVTGSLESSSPETETL